MAEAEAAEAKRVELRRQLDEQVAQKQRRAAMRGRGDGSSYDDAPGPEYSATVSPGIGSRGASTRAPRTASSRSATSSPAFLGAG